MPAARHVNDETRAAIETVVREEWGRVLATLVSSLRDIELAEDALQEACIAALSAWSASGVPDHPRAWLLTAARRKAIDRIRRARNFEAKRAELEVLTRLERDAPEDDMDHTFPDERLRLIFTCCHPALADTARVPLTLRTLGGLSTTEIARAFLVPEATMAQRLVRAKRKIQKAGIPYEVPGPDLWPERLDAVLAVIYLIFNEGYAASSGDTLTRTDLCHEAIRLMRIMARLVPREAEVRGLLALMLLHDARRPARTDENGDFIALEDQDRSLWSNAQIEEGLEHLQAAQALNDVGRYQLEAAVSAIHCRAKSYAETDWSAVGQLYGALYALRPSPVVLLNKAVALSFAVTAEAGLEALSRLQVDGALETYQPYHAARADLLARAGRRSEAAAAYRTALGLTDNQPERRFLEGRLKRLLDQS